MRLLRGWEVGEEALNRLEMADRILSHLIRSELRLLEDPYLETDKTQIHPRICPLPRVKSPKQIRRSRSLQRPS
jgi:hypothetical protein